MKKITPRIITIIAFSVALNYLGSTIALLLRLPIYLDSAGTIFTGALLGPLFGALTGILTSLLTDWIDNGYLFSVLFTCPTLHMNFSRLAPSSAVKSNKITI